MRKTHIALITNNLHRNYFFIKKTEDYTIQTKRSAVTIISMLLPTLSKSFIFIPCKQQGIYKIYPVFPMHGMNRAHSSRRAQLLPLL